MHLIRNGWLWNQAREALASPAARFAGTTLVFFFVALAPSWRSASIRAGCASAAVSCVISGNNAGCNTVITCDTGGLSGYMCQLPNGKNVAEGYWTLAGTSGPFYSCTAPTRSDANCGYTTEPCGNTFHYISAPTCQTSCTGTWYWIYCSALGTVCGSGPGY